MAQENDHNWSVSSDTRVYTPGSQHTNKQILHVEPNADCRFLVSTLLQLEGHVVTSACTAEQARAILERKFIDLYILDNWLPDQSGIKLCRHIRIVHPGARVVFFSGAAYPQDKEEARQAGALEYLIKPDGFSMLPEVMRRLISQIDYGESFLER